jgi:hypothetical protein
MSNHRQATSSQNLKVYTRFTVPAWLADPGSQGSRGRIVQEHPFGDTSARDTPYTAFPNVSTD